MHTFSIPGVAAEVARIAESDGWDGAVFNDTQNISGDPYIEMALAAATTSRLHLATGVTNPVTRHPSVTAAVIAGIQVQSQGRATLGIGRGDSALGHIGRQPLPVAPFEVYLDRVQGYLRGEPVDLDGFASQNQWITGSGQPKVPVMVAAAGPRVIDLAARKGDQVLLALGADPTRVRWGVETARSARESAGGDPDEFVVAAMVNMVVHDDVAVARDLARGGMSAVARFASMPGGSRMLMDDKAQETVERLGRTYDVRQHNRKEAGHAQGIDDDFVDTFGIVGPAGHCRERVAALLECGVDRLVVYGAAMDAGRDEYVAAARRCAADVLPAFK